MQADGLDRDGVSIAADALSLNGATIQDRTGNDAELDLGAHAISNDGDHKVDGSVNFPPAVVGVRIQTDPQTDGTYLRVLYQVQATDADGISVTADALRLNGAKIQDSGGNDAELRPAGPETTRPTTRWTARCKSVHRWQSWGASSPTPRRRASLHGARRGRWPPAKSSAGNDHAAFLIGASDSRHHRGRSPPTKQTTTGAVPRMAPVKPDSTAVKR